MSWESDRKTLEYFLAAIAEDPIEPLQEKVSPVNRVPDGYVDELEMYRYWLTELRGGRRITKKQRERLRELESLPFEKRLTPLVLNTESESGWKYADLSRLNKC